MLIKLDKNKDGDYFRNIKHVLNAHSTSKGEKRQHILSLYTTEKHIVCTDLKTLHTCNNIYGWEPGFYEVIRNLKTSIILIKKNSDNMDCFPGFDPLQTKYPEFENIIATDDLEQVGKVDIYNLVDHIGVSSCYCNIFKKTNALLRFDSFEKSVEFMDSNIEVFYKNNLNPIVIKEGIKTAVLMPLKP